MDSHKNSHFIDCFSFFLKRIGNTALIQVRQINEGGVQFGHPHLYGLYAVEAWSAKKDALFHPAETFSNEMSYTGISALWDVNPWPQHYEHCLHIASEEKEALGNRQKWLSLPCLGDRHQLSPLWLWKQEVTPPLQTKRSKYSHPEPCSSPVSEGGLPPGVHWPLSIRSLW